jgi:hypothetical protein
MFIRLINCEKVYDLVEWKKQINALRMGVDYGDWKLNGVGEVIIIHDGQYSKQEKLQQGVRQGCPLSPQLVSTCAGELTSPDSRELHVC